MFFGLTAEQQRFRDEVRAFFNEAVTPEMRLLEEESEQFRAAGRIIEKELVKHGWWVMHWPVEYGGQARDHITQAILQEEEGYQMAPNGGGHGRFIVGPALMRFGTEEDKKKWLPPIARAETVIGLGYTEPNAGSDLAVMETRAELKGDEYIVNGHKTFITFGHFADALLLAARTDPDAPKHKGITLFMCDMHQPGIRVSPIWCLEGRRVNDVYFEDARIPKTSVVGQVNRGFYHMASALNYERSGVRNLGPLRRLIDDFVTMCKETRYRGRPLSENPLVRQKLAEISMDLEAWRMISWRIVWIQHKGEMPTWEASQAQLFRKDVTPKIGRTLWEIMNMYGLVPAGSDWARMHGRVEHMWRFALNIHGQGGKNVTRNAIARRGLDMPRGM